MNLLVNKLPIQKKCLFYIVFELFCVCLLFLYYKITYDQNLLVYLLFTLLFFLKNTSYFLLFNILIFFRFFLFFILLFITLIAHVFYDDVYVAPFNIQYQQISTTILVVFAIYFSLIGTKIGYFLSFKFIPSYPSFNVSFSYINFGIILTFISCVLYIYQQGGLLFTSSYFSEKKSSVAIYGILHVIGISFIFVGYNFRPPRFIYIFIVLTLLLCVFSGSRADYLPQLFIVLAVIISRSFLNFLYYPTFTQTIKYISYSYLLFGFLFFFSTFIALYRYGINVSAVYDKFISTDRFSLINEVYGHKMIFIETGNHMLGGLYSFVYKVSNEIDNLLLGSSYFDFLVKLPPNFLGFDRPLGLEWFTDINGSIMSQGGIFESAEAYANFGLLGCFFISFLWSFLHSIFYKISSIYYSRFSMIIYLGFGFVGLRAIWYQNFTYVRFLTVIFFVYFLFIVFTFIRQRLIK